MTQCMNCGHPIATYSDEENKTRKIEWLCYVCYMERRDKQDDKVKSNK